MQKEPNSSMLKAVVSPLAAQIPVSRKERCERGGNHRKDDQFYFHHVTQKEVKQKFMNM